MHGGTKETADQNFVSARSKVPLSPTTPLQSQDASFETDPVKKQEILSRDPASYPDNELRYKQQSGVLKTLDVLQQLYHDKKYSKSLQMIAADMMSRSGGLATIKGDTRGGFNDTAEGYVIRSRQGLKEPDSITSMFHEFTHMADANAFGNVLALAFSPDESDEDVMSLIKSNSEKALNLYRFNQDEGAYNYATGVDRYTSYIDGENMKLEYMKQHGQEGTDRFRNEKEKADRVNRLFPKERKDADAKKHEGFQNLNEYDAVLNQMFLHAELTNADRKSQYYRMLKSYALDSHVRRRIATLKRRMNGA